MCFLKEWKSVRMKVKGACVKGENVCMLKERESVKKKEGMKGVRECV